MCQDLLVTADRTSQARRCPEPLWSVPREHSYRADISISVLPLGVPVVSFCVAILGFFPHLPHPNRIETRSLRIPKPFVFDRITRWKRSLEPFRYVLSRLWSSACALLIHDHRSEFEYVAIPIRKSAVPVLPYVRKDRLQPVATNGWASHDIELAASLVLDRLNPLTRYLAQKFFELSLDVVRVPFRCHYHVTPQASCIDSFNCMSSTRPVALRNVNSL